MKKFPSFLSAGFALAASILPATARDQWTPDQAKAWGAKQPWLVGANYANASAINQLEMWQADTFAPAEIDKELGWAEGLGFNTMRVFLHDAVWTADREGFKKRFGQFLDLCAKHKIRPMVVLFDSVWDPEPKLGPQRAPKPGVHNSGWVQGPGKAILADETKWPKLKEYVQDIVGSHKDDARVLAWDIVNEPDNDNANSYGKNGTKAELPDKAARGFKLVREAVAWAREANPSQPITGAPWHTMGKWGEPGAGTEMNAWLFANSDVITFHSYENPAEFERSMKACLKFGRPVLCTEYMARPRGSTFETILPIAKRAGVGMLNWGFVAGKSNTIFAWDTWQKPCPTKEPEVWFHDIFRIDGSPFRQSEVDFIKSQTGKK